MNARRRRPTRRGFTLIELVLLIGSVSIILVLCGALIHMLLRLDRSGRDALDDSTGLARLARQFRRDVHSSGSAKPGEADGSLELTRDDAPAVRYRVVGERLVREEGDGKTVVRRESYPVRRLGPVSFERDGPLVRLTLARRPTTPHAPPRPSIAVEARLDKNRSPEARK